MLELTQIYFFFSMLLVLMVYAAIATVKLRMCTWIKVLIIPACFILTYQLMVVSETLVGRPSYSESEAQGTLAGYVIFERSERKQIAVLLNTKEGPMLYAVPYDPNMEKNLSQAMQKLTTKGIPTMVRKKGKSVANESDGKEGNGNSNKEGKQGTTGEGVGGGGMEGPLEFYDFTEQYLVPKDPSAQ